MTPYKMDGKRDTAILMRCDGGFICCTPVRHELSVVGNRNREPDTTFIEYCQTYEHNMPI